jgi:hypothetical protein
MTAIPLSRPTSPTGTIAFYVCLMAMLEAATACSSHAVNFLHTGAPRGGVIIFTADAPAPFGRQMATVDSDEPTVKLLNLPDTATASTSFGLDLEDRTFYDDLGGTISITPSQAVTQAPQALDAGNWALGIGVYESGLLTNFLQLRLQGSGATVAENQLTAQAVASGLWPGPSEYFEFPSHHAVISQLTSPATGPASFISSVLPEPSSSLLAAVAATLLSSLRRNSALRPDNTHGLRQHE